MSDFFDSLDPGGLTELFSPDIWDALTATGPAAAAAAGPSAFSNAISQFLFPSDPGGLSEFGPPIPAAFPPAAFPPDPFADLGAGALGTAGLPTSDQGMIPSGGAMNPSLRGGLTPAGVPGTALGMGGGPGGPGGMGGGPGGPGGMGGGPPAPANPWIGAGLGALGPALGLFGAATGANQTQTSPELSAAQRNALNQAQFNLDLMSPYARSLGLTGTNMLQAYGPLFAAGQTPLQAQQASILGALGPTAAAMGQGDISAILGNPLLQRTIQTAYQPYIASLTQQAIDAARSRGFAGGADLLGGAAAPFAGQALANLPGMQAQSAMEWATRLPQTAANLAGAYNQPINQQGNFALQFPAAMMGPQLNMPQNWMNLARSVPSGTIQSGGGGVMQDLAALGTGAAGGYNAAQQQAQQNTLLNLMTLQQGGGGSSWQNPYGMSGAY